MNNNLGRAISNLRKSKGMTQKDLAEALHISDKSISRWECGYCRPSLEMMFEISEYFNVSFINLITARVSDKHEDDKVVENIVNELTGVGEKRAKIIKVGLTISIIIIVFLIGIFIFSSSYNKFKVYKVYGEGENIDKFYGTYIETKMRDILYFGDIKIKDIQLKDTDIVSVDLYIIKDNEEIIIKNYSDLNEIYFVLSEDSIEIKNFSDYFDNVYLRISITDELGNTKEYEVKMQFVLDFSNNKIYYNDNFLVEEYTYEVTDYSEVDVEKILLDNEFEMIDGNTLYKKNGKDKISYQIDAKVLSYSYEKNGFRYKYKYKLNSNILIVSICDDNLSIVQDYEFDINNKKMNCNVGSCSGYEEVMEILDKNILNLLK